MLFYGTFQFTQAGIHSEKENLMIAQKNPWFLSALLKWQFWVAVVIVVAGPGSLEAAKKVRALFPSGEAVIVAVPADKLNVVAPPPPPLGPGKDPFQKKTDGCWAGTGAKGGYQLLAFLSKYAGQTVSLVFRTQGSTVLAQFLANDGGVTVAVSQANGTFSLGSFPSRLEFVAMIKAEVKGSRWAPSRAWAAIRGAFKISETSESSVTEEAARQATGTEGC